MRIAVISDTHRQIYKAVDALKTLGPLDMVLHAGDFYADALEIALRTGLPVTGVVGNCDGMNDPEEEVVEVGGYRIFLTHGHRYWAKMGLWKLQYRAQELGVQLVVFGHTHVAMKEEMDGILFFNPGSIASPRKGKASLGLLEIEKGKLEARLVEF